MKSKYTYGERKAFGRGVKCGFAKKVKKLQKYNCKKKKYKMNRKSNFVRNSAYRSQSTNGYTF